MDFLLSVLKVLGVVIPILISILELLKVFGILA